MTWTTRCALMLVALLLACSGALAQPGPASAAPTPPEITLETLRAKVEQVPESADTDEDVQRLMSLTDEITAESERFVASRTTQLNDLNARLGELGPAPAAGATSSEDPDITRQRATLTKQRNAIDADIRLARLLIVNAQQHRTEMLAQRRAVFEAKLFERSLSPLTAHFWERMSDEWKGDKDDLAGLSKEFSRGLESALGGSSWFFIVLGLLLGIGALALAIRVMEAALAWLAASSFPIGRLRRSLLALLTVVAYVLIAGLAGSIVWGAINQMGDWGTRSSRLADTLVQMLMFLAFVVGLGRAMLSNRRPSWRLPPISDPVARRLWPMPWLVALCALVSATPISINQVIDDPLNSVLTNLVPVAAFLATCVAMVFVVRQSRADASSAEAAGPDAAPAERPAWVSVLRGLVGILLLALLLLVAVGYLAFARVLAGQILWAGIVAVLGYLLLKFADDLWMSLLSSRSTSGQKVQKSMGVRPQTLDQAAVLMSALSRIVVIFYMVVAFIAPLGSTPGELAQRSGRMSTRLKVGEFELDSSAILGSIAVLIVGFMLLRLFKRWLENSYLPNTQLESGMRSSITTLLGYVGAVLVVALALSALGIGVNRIAWVASALSVGIGFGLQAIVQNFISGLILLAERPVKVGDWVVLGTSEGDVRRINVRATEIQLGDRSTLIVPNSEFITKTVRNMTLANAEGRVLIRLPMPLTTDAQLVREVMLKACREHASVLPSPEPGVTLDGIENGLLVFQAIAFVPNPRMASGVRSDLLFTILDGLRQAQLPMAVYMSAPVPGTLGASLAPATPAAPPPPPSPLSGT
ncbi:MAG: mechanosensitive ion channel family protein [Proteobacteria bacterium]|nr:mechanosensitive ion channel family protein [Pseudomonadota bacterium]